MYMLPSLVTLLDSTTVLYIGACNFGFHRLISLLLYPSGYIFGFCGLTVFLDTVTFVLGWIGFARHNISTASEDFVALLTLETVDFQRLYELLTVQKIA